MAKEIEGGEVRDHTVRVTVGKHAFVTTDDGMEYHFYKPKWSNQWLFSHRVIEDDGEKRVNADNRRPPDAVIGWANKNFKHWDFFDGRFMLEEVQGFKTLIIKSK
jgi:hypothetical protein